MWWNKERGKIIPRLLERHDENIIALEERARELAARVATLEETISKLCDHLDVRVHVSQGVHFRRMRIEKIVRWQEKLCRKWGFCK